MLFRNIYGKNEADLIPSAVTIIDIDIDIAIYAGVSAAIFPPAI